MLDPFDPLFNPFDPFILLMLGLLLLMVMFFIKYRIQDRRARYRTERIKATVQLLGFSPEYLKTRKGTISDLAMFFVDRQKFVRKHQSLELPHDDFRVNKQGYELTRKQTCYLNRLYSKRETNLLIQVVDLQAMRGKRSFFHTVIYVYSNSLNLPKFYTTPERGIEKIHKIFGDLKDIDLASYPEFSKSHILCGEKENLIRDFFESDMTNFLLSKSNYTVEGDGHVLLVYQQDSHLIDDDLVAIIDSTKDLVSLLSK